MESNEEAFKIEIVRLLLNIHDTKDLYPCDTLKFSDTLLATAYLFFGKAYLQHHKTYGTFI